MAVLFTVDADGNISKKKKKKKALFTVDENGNITKNKEKEEKEEKAKKSSSNPFVQGMVQASMMPDSYAGTVGSLVGQFISDKISGGGYFQKGAFDKDVSTGEKVVRSVYGTKKDIDQDLTAGIVGMGEKAVDAAASLAPYAIYSQSMSYDSPASQFGAEVGRWIGGLLTGDKNANATYHNDLMNKVSQAEKEVDEFIKKDLYDEQAVANKIVAGVSSAWENALKIQSGAFLTPEDLERQRQQYDLTLGYMENEMESDSVLGEKSDALVQSVGQLAAQYGLSYIGVPWFVTSGVTSYGGEVENALQQGATHGEAVGSGLITAGAEVLSEKLFSGDIFTKHAGADIATKYITTAISDKAMQKLAKAGLDVAGEGFEEVFSQFMSRLGSSLYKEEKVGEILFSEEALEEYLDSAIGGWVLGGGMTAINVATSKNNGTDFVTGMQTDERAVIDKVHEALVAEEQSKSDPNKKISAKKKAELWENAVAAMDRGDINIEKIEEILGGDSYKVFSEEWRKLASSEDYKAYRKAAEEEKKIRDEFKPLAEMVTEKMTGEQIYRREDLKKMLDASKVSELKAKIAPEASRVFQLREKMRGEVMGRVGNTRLAESYAEYGRSKQKFTVDVNKYTDENARKTVQNILDSKMGDNTNKFHHTVDFLARLSADKGVVFDLTNNEQLGVEHTQEGYITNGYVSDDGNIVLNYDSPTALNTTVGHEITHILEKAGAYKALQGAVADYAIAKEGLDKYNARIKAAEEAYKGKKNTTAEAEVTADLIGEYLFTDYDFVSNLAATDRNVFQKIYDEIKYMVKIATAGSHEARELEKVKKMFEKAYRESANVKTEAKTEVKTESEVEAEANEKYSIRKEAPPKETKTAYKLMRLVDGELYPLFIGNNEKISVGTWYNADSPNLSQLKNLSVGTHLVNMETGEAISWDEYAEQYVPKKNGQPARNKPNKDDVHWANENGYRFMHIEDKAGGKSEGRMLKQYGDTRAYYNWGVNGSSKSATGEGSASLYALRPGWHFGEVPSMHQIGYGGEEGDTVRLDNQVWVEVEMAADVDYNAEAESNWGGDIPTHIPTDGYYKFATNPTQKKTKSGKTKADAEKADWYVAGAFKVNRIMSDAEADAVVEKYNADNGKNVPLDYRRNGGRVFNAETMTVEDGAKYSYSSIANSFFGDEDMSTVEFLAKDYHETEFYKSYVDTCLNNMQQTMPDFDISKVDDYKADIRKQLDGIVSVAVAMKQAGYDIADTKVVEENGTEKVVPLEGITDSKDRKLFSSLEPNSDYITSHDISTICDKRKNFAEIYDEIVRREEALGVPTDKRFFNDVNNYFAIHKIMADKGLTTPCRQCYVESMRKNLAPMATAFLELVQETNPDNTKNAQLYHQRGKDMGHIKESNESIREGVLAAIAEHPEYNLSVGDLTIEMLTTEDGLAQLRIQAPLVYEAFNSFYGQAKPKMPKSPTPFRFGELTAMLTDAKGRVRHKTIEKINSTGGFRLQSYSDFQIQNYADVLQVLFEAGTLGLNGHAYTKVPAFLDATEGTNLKRNISIFMYKDGNEWKLDRNDSFPYTLDEIYELVKADKTGNTSIIAVSQNNEMSAWIMANDLVGYGIPFHKSGLKMGTVRETVVRTEDGREVRGYSNTKDHTKQQTEVYKYTLKDEEGKEVQKANTKVKKGINIYQEGLWDFTNEEGLSRNELIKKNVTAYLDACEEAGYRPKFRDYVMNNDQVLKDVLRFSKELGYVGADATIDDISFEYKDKDGNVIYRVPYGYYKFLGDFGMFTPDGKAAPQKPLSLTDYDFAKAEAFFKDAESLRRTEILQQFANGKVREEYRESDLTTEDLEGIVAQKRKEVADEVVKYSMSKADKAKADKEYMDAVGRGDEETLKHLVGEYAKAAMPDSKLVDENGNLRVVYHGTNTGDFTVFNPDYIGMSSGDSGFFGMGFYFAYSKGEASYYGATRVIPAYLDLKNPFNFDRELQTYNGKKAQTGKAPDAVALMNFADKFPDIAMSITLDVSKEYGSVESISVFEFAKAFKDVIENKKFEYQEVENSYGETEILVTADPQVHEYEYNGETHSYRDFGFQKRWYGTPNELDVAYEYLSNSVYSYIDMPRRTNVILDNNEAFTSALKEMGYDGAIQSDYGDEAVAFEPSQIKSAAPITYDGEGKVIPLSKRFDRSNDDIRYSMTKIDEQVNAYEYNLEHGDTLGAEIAVEELANLVMPDSKIRGEDGRLIPLYHGTKEMFYEYDPTIGGGKNGTAEGFGIYLSDNQEVTKAYGDRQIKQFVNITKPATSFNKTITTNTLVKLIKDTCEKEAQRMVAEDGYDNIREALKDTWVSNYADTYGTSMDRVYREVAQSMLQQNDSDKDIIHEVMFGMAIRDYPSAMRFYRESLTPVTGFDGFITKWDNASTGETSNIYLAFDSSQLKSADAITYDDNGNVIPITERFNFDKKDIRYSMSKEGEEPNKYGDWHVYGSDFGNNDALAEFEGVPIAETAAESGPYEDNWQEAFDAITDEDVPPIPEDTSPAKEISTTAEKIKQKIKNTQAELDKNRELRQQSFKDYSEEIARLQEKYDSKRNKNYKVAQGLLRAIERMKRLQGNIDADYAKRISDLEARVEKMHSQEYQTAEHRRAKMEEHTKFWEDLIGDTSTWKDMSLGLSYKTKTLRRILRKVVRGVDGKTDFRLADDIYDELETKYDHNEALLKRESQRLKEVFFGLKLNNAEDTYAHMLGELRHNPDTELTEDVVKEYYDKHKKQINQEKVDKAIEESRKTFDELIGRLNEVLREQGFKEIPYRQGYFPHFTNPKQNWLHKLFNWKPVDNEIPTSIAGLTDQFKPQRSWQSFDKRREGDKTDYSLYQGLDTYIHGALDWIYHIEDLQKRRALENWIRYTHSEEGVKQRIKEIKANETYDADEAQDMINAILDEANNPLSGLVRELMNRTNTLANKKSSMDRGMEDATNRKIYSTMTNLNNRINANMVVGSVSSALTNFIPMVQSWHQVSPYFTVRGLGDYVRSVVRDDGMVEKSDFLTNRLVDEEKLYQTGWDKVSDKAGWMMSLFDGITSQTVWRSKYLQNLKEGMSESAAIKDADQFAKNLMAGRSRGNAPTIFDAKNPLIKIATAFQLEVANQYGFMFEDTPQDTKSKARLVKGYATAFMGAYLYNALYSSLVGRDAAFDPISIIEDLLKGLFDDEEEPEDVILDTGKDILEEVPYIGGLLGGGRIPISSALPYSSDSTPFKSMLTDVTDGNWDSFGKEFLKPLYYLAMPVGGGQLKKTIEGLSMFDDDLPISGSYTDSGKLRFPVEKSFGNMLQAGLFGQYASENARTYFDEGYSPMGEGQIQEFLDVDIPIRDYWEYRKGLQGLGTIGEKADYINDMDIPIDKKNLLINNATDREEPIDMTDYDDFGSFEEFDWAQKNPEKYAISRAVTPYWGEYLEYTETLNEIRADKDANGKTISGSAKEKKMAYIESLNIDYGAKLILHKSQYKSDDAYNRDIVEYLYSRTDLTDEDRVTILTELGFTVKANGIYWD